MAPLNVIMDNVISFPHSMKKELKIMLSLGYTNHFTYGSKWSQLAALTVKKENVESIMKMVISSNII